MNALRGRAIASPGSATAPRVNTRENVRLTFGQEGRARALVRLGRPEAV